MQKTHGIMRVKEDCYEILQFHNGCSTHKQIPKAKKDLIAAINSYEELAPQEKELLMCEFFGAENVAFLQSILTQTGR